MRNAWVILLQPREQTASVVLILEFDNIFCAVIVSAWAVAHDYLSFLWEREILHALGQLSTHAAACQSPEREWLSVSLNTTTKLLPVKRFRFSFRTIQSLGGK